MIPQYMDEALSSVFVNWSYSDWACEKAYTALFVYYPNIVNQNYVPSEWLFITASICIVIGGIVGWYARGKNNKTG